MNYRFAMDMKYLALYWALGFVEINEDIFAKTYKGGYKVIIDAGKQYVDFGNRITIIGGKYLPLNTHKSFVILECVNKLLCMGYLPSEIIIDSQNEFDIYAANLYIKCFEWKHMDDSALTPKQGTFISIKYESRLVSGMIERKTEIRDGQGVYEYGIFESRHKLNQYQLRNKKTIYNENPDFVIEDDIFVKYSGREKRVIIPDGIKTIGACAFWDNQSIEEVVLPDSLINLGGDVFYNCTNLKKITIPRQVERMGNDPFAGCLNLVLKSKSKYYQMSKNVLFSKDKKRLIHYSSSEKRKTYKIPNSVQIIGKHAFFLANHLEKIVIPSSVIKLENNPFSGCDRLNIKNKSRSYHIIDSVIYNKYKSSVVGCLNSIKTDRLELLPIKNICRNSFWNCAGIKTIVLPSSLEQIGYNPFVGCSNINFENHSSAYVVIDHILYTSDMKKLVCCPSWKSIGEVKIVDSVETLERGAFSGSDKMTAIDFNNVKVISKTCFTNCNSLTNVYIPDSVIYLGEWAFAHCDNMKTISISKNTLIDNNAFLNNPTKVIVR